MLDIVNQRRAEGADCGAEGSFGPAGPLSMAPALRCAARVHSKQMVESDFFAHTTPWGETPGNRIDASGYDWSTWGENIAAGNATAAATMDQWMGSDGHCANIMNASFSEIGVGYFPGGGYGHYWTQAFGHP
ncbi:MAG: CAP domain-containing protein [Deltaproteobacteria bacterium]|nr:CAP domain-containing protein [Nannocystaceae bacterium]